MKYECIDYKNIFNQFHLIDTVYNVEMISKTAKLYSCTIINTRFKYDFKFKFKTITELQCLLCFVLNRESTNSKVERGISGTTNRTRNMAQGSSSIQMVRYMRVCRFFFFIHSSKIIWSNCKVLNENRQVLLCKHYGELNSL